jgi:hypothetical protein
MRTVYGAIALFTVAAIIGISGPVLAADPAQSDFDACNREAQSANPSASVAAGTSGSTSTGGGSSSPGSIGSSPSGSMGAGSSATAPTGSDSSLRGIAAAGMNDPAYQQAYRDCLTRRGF